ncbi:MAG TPA: hypothetical protein VJJ81_01265 [Candidatus Babeliales bacterium]|nr:hypothetical protein [Candidatus Babeliales bacterium]
MKSFNLYLIVPFLALGYTSIGACDRELTPSQLDRLNVLDKRLGSCIRSVTSPIAIEEWMCGVFGSCSKPYSFNSYRDSYNADDCKFHHSCKVADLLKTRLLSSALEEYSQCVSAKAYTDVISGDLSDCRKVLVEDMKFKKHSS